MRREKVRRIYEGKEKKVEIKSKIWIQIERHKMKKKEKKMEEHSLYRSIRRSCGGRFSPKIASIVLSTFTSKALKNE